MSRTVRLTDERGPITLDELEDFVKDARNAGVHGREPITGDVRGNGDLKVIEAELP